MEKTNIDLNIWKSKYMRVLNTITVLAIIFGTLFHVVRFVGMGILGSLFINRKNASSVEVVDGSCSFSDPFDEIEGELDMGNLEIVYGDSYAMDYVGYPSGKEPQAEVKNGKLKIKQDSSNWSLFKDKLPSDCKTVITIPKDCTPALDMKLSMGSINMDGMGLNDVILHADMGSITLKDCEAGYLELNAEMGSIDLKNCSFDKGDMDAAMGGITLKDVTFDSAECDADMGSIEVSGSYASLTANCDMGSIEVQSDRDDTEYDLECDMGDVEVNGKDMGRSYKN